MSEKQLLDSLIEEELGKGKAQFDVNVGRNEKRIDLVFEKGEDVWLIEAKKKLDFEALGRIITCGKLYQPDACHPKNVKLGIVCGEADLEVGSACDGEGVQVFICDEADQESATRSPICGICGDQMVEDNGEHKCKTCEHFFGLSSVAVECRSCHAGFGSYPAIERKILGPHGDYFAHEYWRKGLCPNCREKKRPKWATWSTIADLIEDDVRRRHITPYQLRVVHMLPKEFIDYCLVSERSSLVQNVQESQQESLFGEKGQW